MIVSLWGDEGSGKSSVGLSFPKPLFHLDLDLGGFERAIWRVEEEARKAGNPLRIIKLSDPPIDDISQYVTYEPDLKLSDINWSEWDIVSKPYVVPLQVDKLLGIQQKQAGVTVRFPKQVVGIKEIWQEIVTDTVAVGRVKIVKTILPDSATRLWSICHTGFLQEKQEIQLDKGMKVTDPLFREQLKPVEFPNDRMRDLIYTVKSFGKHLVMTHYPKDIYANKVTDKGIESYATGEVTPDGFKHTVTLDDIVLWCFAEVDKRREIIKGVLNDNYNRPVPRAKISLKCGLRGLGMKAVGLELPTPDYEGILELQRMMSGE